MLVAIVSCERRGDLLLRGLAAGVPVPSPYRGVGLPSDDVAQDRDPRGPGDVALITLWSWRFMSTMAFCMRWT